VALLAWYFTHTVSPPNALRFFSTPSSDYKVQKPMKLVKIFMSAMAVGVIACGGGQAEKPPVPETPDPSLEPASHDEKFDYEAIKVDGMRFFPDALGMPGMWKISVPKKANLKKQRKIAAAKGAGVADLQVLAALAWQESSDVYAKARKEPDEAKKAKLDEQIKALRTEARDALRQAYTLAGEGKADEVTLKLLSVAEMTLGDEAAATKVYAEIAARFPGDGGATNAKIWLTHLYLKADKLKEAATVVDGWTLDDKLDPMGAYVMAWVRFRQRDYPAARDAIVFAAKNWKSNSGRREVSTDVLLFLARSGTPVDRAKAAVVDSLGPDGASGAYIAMYNLSKGYRFAGYENLASATLALLVSGEVQAEVPDRDKVLFGAERAYDELKVGNAAATAAAAIAAHERLAACADKCAGDAAAMTTALHTYGSILHTVYAHSFDPAYYDAAKKLYDYYLAIDGAADHEMVKGYAGRLEDTKANADVTQGKLNKEETGKVFVLRNNTARACYESVLQSEPSLNGKLTLTLNVSDAGEVIAAETDPAKGQAGMAAVGGCLAERVKSWRFPMRTLKGTTALVQLYSFSLAPPPAAKQPEK
jgi:hypothetical protein